MRLNINRAKSMAVRVVNRLLPTTPPTILTVRDWVEKTERGRIEGMRPKFCRKLRLPLTDEENIDAAFSDVIDGIEFPERYLAVVSDVTLRGPDGFVIFDDGTYSTETAPLDWLEPHPAYRHRIQAKPQMLEGPFYCLLSMHCREYYHWILDVLPRLYMTLDRLPPDLKFLVPANMKDYQKWTLEQVGVPPERLCLYDQSIPVRVDELWYTPLSAPDRFDDPNALAWLSEKLWKNVDPPSESETNRRLFISRASAPSRRCVNESDLLPILESYGFELVMPETMSLPEQMRLFNSAEIVLGAHGAGFTNILFCKPGTQILEIFPESVGFRTYYWSLARAKGLSYGYTKANSLPCEKGPEFANIRIDPDRLNFFLGDTYGIPKQ